MADLSDLDRLALLSEIEPVYLDVWKKPHAVPDDTKRALLAAMGYATEPDRIGDSVRAREERHWRRLLPPVGVFLEDQPIEVSAVLPATAGRLGWRIEAEDLQSSSGEVSPDELELIECRTLDDGRHEQRRLVLPVRLPLGYHRLTAEWRGEDGTRQVGAEMRLIVAPQRCWSVVEAAGEERIWGVAVQIYSLRSDRNWGMGDLSDLGKAAEDAAAVGADTLGINPIHAMFPADPHHFAPYSPSNRAFANFLYVDLEAMPELPYCPEVRARIDDPAFKATLQEARAAELIDHAAASALKLPLLESLFRCFVANPEALAAEHREFAAFRAEVGPSLEKHAVFEALHEHFFRGGAGSWAWQDWPEPYRRHDSAEVAAFAAERRDRVDFFAWLQWSVDRQLGTVQRRARDAGMRIGLYRDLAVAAHSSGSAAWMHPELVLYGAAVGAPPDELAPHGQNWGIAPLSPDRLRETAYEPFIVALRANMRHAGALRIDHAMVLRRLFCIPEGMSGADGAYVSYPLTDLLRIIALESRRSRCVVIGEDLGTVPEGFQEALEQAGILSYRILTFERTETGFKPPEAYPRQALAAPSTHDLPTLKGFWTGRDLEWRERLSGPAGEAIVGEMRRQRDLERTWLADALQRSGDRPARLPETEAPDAASMAALRSAVYGFLARSPAAMVLIPIEDLTGEVEQPNLPGTTDEHPNWRRKLPRTSAEIFADPDVRELARTVAALRRQGGSGSPPSV